MRYVVAQRQEIRRGRVQLHLDAIMSQEVEVLRALTRLHVNQGLRAPQANLLLVESRLPAAVQRPRDVARIFLVSAIFHPVALII